MGVKRDVVKAGVAGLYTGKGCAGCTEEEKNAPRMSVIRLHLGMDSAVRMEGNNASTGRVVTSWHRRREDCALSIRR